MRQIKTFCGVVAVLVLLSACGSKGPLYLPTPEQTGAPAPTKDNAKDPAESRK